MGKCQSTPGHFEDRNFALNLSIEKPIMPKRLVESPKAEKENIKNDFEFKFKRNLAPVEKKERSVSIQDIDASKQIFAKPLRNSIISEIGSNNLHMRRDSVMTCRESNYFIPETSRSRSQSNITNTRRFPSSNRDRSESIRTPRHENISSRYSRLEMDFHNQTLNNSFEGHSVCFDNEIRQTNYHHQPKIISNQNNGMNSANLKKLPAHVLPHRFGLQDEFFRGYFNQLPSSVKEILVSLGPFDYETCQNDALNESEFYGPVNYLDSIYFGQLVNGLREGRGFMIWADGIVYEGFWKGDSTNGRGRLTNATGEFYEGEFLNDKAHGYGTFWSPDSTYTGYWFSDLPHGRGKEEWADGSYYEGDYSRGNKHGQGSFKFADNSQYKGGFFENFLHGRGIYKWSDGREYDGCWAFNKMQGSGIFIWPDGRKYTGEYNSDKKQGQGIYEWPDGRKYSGLWKNGKQDGYGILQMPNNEVIEGEWKNGHFNKSY